MIAAFLLLAALADGGSANAKVTFEKSFPGSSPAYVLIWVEKSGSGEFRTEPDDQWPIKFQLRPEEADAMFGLAQKLDLAHALEAPVKVANMGAKTLRFEHDGTKAEQHFNYSQDLTAIELTKWFERISTTEQTYIALERAVKFDKMGVNDALLELQSLWEKKELTAAAQFLPMLDRVSKNEGYLNMARHRAMDLAATFRATP